MDATIAPRPFAPLALPPRPDPARPFLERAKLTQALGQSWAGMGETPAHSNRGALPDYVLRTAGTDTGQPWCAATAYTLRQWGGFWVPARDGASCDAWRDQAEKAGLWRSAGEMTLAEAPPMSVVLYTNWQKLKYGPYAGRFDAEHAGLLCVADAGRPRFDLEGNTSCADYNRDGDTMCCKPPIPGRIYGYVLPDAATAAQFPRQQAA